MPALLEITVRPLTPLSRMASISVSGMPQRPKPPAMIVISSFRNPASAEAASGCTFFILTPPEITVLYEGKTSRDVFPAPSGRQPQHRPGLRSRCRADVVLG